MTIAVVLMPDADVKSTSDDAGFGALSTARGCLPLRALDVSARIDALLAEVDVRQTFVNSFDEPIEATYIFPLPDRAAVRAFRMEVAGRVIDGVLKERGEARQEYDAALKAGHRAGIAEEERPDVFTMRVGNLMPGDTAVVHLTLVGPLEYDDGEATFRFPLVVAPRYIPGSPLPGRNVGDGVQPDTDAVPDASRISPPVWLPGFPSPVQLSLSVDLPIRILPEDGFRSSLHALVSEPAEGGWRLKVQPGERLNRDFILRYRPAGEQIRTSLTTTPDTVVGGEEGTFALTLLPPAGLAAASRPRDVVFVLDRSGSMAGWKMVAARRALGRLIDTLTPRDRFTVYAFDDRIETPPLANGFGLIAASDRARFRTIEFLAKIDSRNGTEMAQPLDRAVQALSEDMGRDRILVLLTDGQVGNEDQILKMLAPRLAGIRIFTLGIDQAVNAGFLRRLAMAGGGSFDVVESEDRLDDVMDKIQRRIGPPVLSNLTLEGDGIDTSTLTTPKLPDIFAGSPLTLLGRFRGRMGPVRLRGIDAAGREWSQILTPEPAAHRAATPVWARGMVRALEDRYVIGERDPAAAAKRIVDLSFRFGVLCRFTAFVAVDRSAVVNAGGKPHTVVQPVEAPAGWAMLASAASPALRKPLACAPMRAVPDSISECLDEISQFDGNGSGLLGRASRKLRAFFNAPPSPPRDDADGEEEQLSARENRAQERRRRAEDRREQSEGEAKRVKQQAFPKKKLAEKEAGMSSIDLSAYRRQAEELLAALRANNDRRQGLGVLATRLAALIEDLRSIGALRAEIEPLEKLLAELRSSVDMDRTFVEAERVLTAFVGDRAKAFWK